MTNHAQRPDTSFSWLKLTALIALLFGLVTIFSGGSVLFGPVQAQEWAGNYIRFVVWFNFLAGGLYVIAAIGMWRCESWAVGLAGFIALATALVAFGFAIVVVSGAMFEMRTVGALAFRIGFWVVAAIVARRAKHRLIAKPRSCPQH